MRAHVGGSGGRGGIAGRGAEPDGGNGGAISGSGGAVGSAGTGGGGTSGNGGVAGVGQGGVGGTTAGGAGAGSAGGTTSSNGQGGIGGIGGEAGARPLGGAAGGGGMGGAGSVTTPGESVLMHHNHLNRDGVYVQPALTKTAAAGLYLDPFFRASFVGRVYAQPLYVDNGPGGTDLIIVATESDTVYALDASSGQQVWSRTLGIPVPLADMPCGSIDPLGITGTPVIDFASRTMFVAAITTPDDGPTKEYEIFALSIDDGSVRPGWPVDMASTVTGGLTTFTASVQSQRGALAIVNGILYVPFGGLGGDCGDYRGWLVAIPISNPANLQAWSTAGKGGGIWGPGGVASDGTNVFVTTGNTIGATNWVGGEAVISFPASLPLATAPSYWAPTEWPSMDQHDLDLGSVGPLVFDLPGATPGHLILAMGKSGTGYLADADNLGGIADAVATIKAGATVIYGAHAIYSTAAATYVVFRSHGEYCTGGTLNTDLATLKLVPGAPPKFGPSWCTTATGIGSPIVTTTDGHSEAIVWVVGAEGGGNELLQGFDGDTGAIIFDGGNVPISARRFTAPIAAKGRIFVAADNTVAAFAP